MRGLTVQKGHPVAGVGLDRRQSGEKRHQSRRVKPFLLRLLRHGCRARGEAEQEQGGQSLPEDHRRSLAGRQQRCYPPNSCFSPAVSHATRSPVCRQGPPSPVTRDPIQPRLRCMNTVRRRPSDSIKHNPADRSTRTAPQARLLLAELTCAHLLNETAPGRFTFHDLLCAYATELVQTHEADPDRHAATQRMLDYYRSTALA